MGFGDTAPGGSPDTARVPGEAVRAQGRRVLASRGRADLAPGDGADDCFTPGEVDRQALFGRTAAVVRHGGAMVVVPRIVDQPHRAARFAESGIGAARDGPIRTVESLSAALRTALTPATRERANTVATAMLFELISRDRPPLPAWTTRGPTRSFSAQWGFPCST